jgi:hypothetical protein
MGHIFFMIKKPKKAFNCYNKVNNKTHKKFKGLFMKNFYEKGDEYFKRIEALIETHNANNEINEQEMHERSINNM